MWSALSNERTDLSFTIVAGPRQRSHSGVRVPWDVTIFYCLRFETSLVVAYYDSQGYGGGIRPRLRTGLSELSSKLVPLITLRHEQRRKHSISIVACVYVAGVT
jgi:hypothetical protein